MAFGFPPEHRATFPLKETDRRHFMMFALEAIRELGWQVVFFNQNKIVAATPFPAKRWNEEVWVILKEEGIEVISQSEGGGISDGGQNQKNVHTLWQAIQQNAQRQTVEEAKRKYEAIRFLLPNYTDESSEPKAPLTLKEKGIRFFNSVVQNTRSITGLLVAINVVVYLLMLLNGVDSISPSVADLLSWGGNTKMNTLNGEAWRLFTCFFVHGGLLHLLLNMYGLLFIGKIIEQEVGGLRLLAGYLIMGLGGSMASLWWNDNLVSVGASGAIFGLFGMFFALHATERLQHKANQALFANAIFFVGLNLIIGAAIDMFDNAGHIGGLVAGVVVGTAFYPSLTGKQNRAKAALHALAVLLIGLGFYAVVFAFVPDWPVKYQRNLQLFTENEEKALDYFKLSDFTSTAQRLAYLQDESIPQWEANIGLMDELLSKKELPVDIRARVFHLKTYAKLRQRSFELISQNMQQPEQDFTSEIQELELAIRDELIFLNPTEPENYLARSKSREAKGDLEGAIDDLNNVLLLGFEDLDVLLRRARLYRETGQFLKSVQDYRKLLSSLPADYDLLMELGATYELANEFASAISVFSQAIITSPNASPAYNARGWSYYKLNEFDAAEADYLKAIELNQAYASAFNNLGILAETRNQWKKAEGYFNKALEVDGQADFALRNLGRLHYNQKRYQEALRYYGLAIASQPQNAANYYARATVYLQTDQPQKLIADMDTAIAYSPQEAYLYELRAIGKDQAGQKQQAVQDLSKAIEIDSTSHIHRSYRAGIYLDLEQYDSAASDFQKCIALSPEYSTCYGNYGWLFYLQKQYDSCIYYSQKAIALDPSAFYAKYNNALAHLCNGNTQLAQELYRSYAAEQLKTGEPINPGAINDLKELQKTGTFQAEVAFILNDIFKVK